MKKYYYFMYFSAVCSSFKGVKCVIQTFKDPKYQLKICQTQKISEI